ncbi:hypothetical protein [Celeribacter neptunius]|uniref:Cytochrome c domain-containing protein n=1 Tax=Celeribacter neptunius TaxID=588602 RepID=A0A1I3KVI0_9RHOB|nr:hypothetical protein [Celeribacter neptunius]SFI76529.1 hypothetical protein SAMN04487991_0812 [Celeribacter neptunius]
MSGKFRRLATVLSISLVTLSPGGLSAQALVEQGAEVSAPGDSLLGDLLPGDPQRGEMLFVQGCGRCHRDVTAFNMTGFTPEGLSRFLQDHRLRSVSGRSPEDCEDLAAYLAQIYPQIVPETENPDSDR